MELSAIANLVNEMAQTPESTNGKYSAVVSRVDDEGTVWVHLAGSEIETPTAVSSSEISAGDAVTVEWRNNKLYIAGNITNPSAGIATVRPSVNYVNDLIEQDITVNSINAATGYIGDLTADHITAGDISASSGYIKELQADNITAQDIVADHATVGSLDSNYAHITNGTIDNAKIGYADVNDLNAHYAGIDLANVNNAWIQNGVVKDAAITDAQIIGVSANKLTAGTIDASNITVTNLNASNITTGSITVDGITIDVENNESSIDGAYIEDGTITMNGFAQEVKDVIDGAIETFTGTVVPTLNNAPANAWTTTKLKDQHIGDVYYVVNSSSEQNGYCYRFTKSGSTYSWQLIKDSDVTAALQRLQTAEGKIGNIETFDEQMATFKTETEGEISTLQTKTTSLETSLGDKVDTSTFNTLSQTVDGNSASITTLTTTTQTLRNDLDGLEIGGRNLILDTATQRVSPASASGSAYVSPIPTLSAYGQSIFTNTDDYWTYSFDYEVTGNSSTKSDIYFQAKGTMASGSSLVVSGNESGHYSKTFKLDSTQASATNTACRICLRNATDGAVLTVNKIKLEKGNKETDWSPAPEDMEETVTTISNTVNTVSQTATTNSSHISQLTTTLGTNADGTTKAGDVMHQVSQLDQDLDGITTRVGKTEVQILGQYATSTTAKGTAAKVATITPSVTGWALYTGATITVKFTNENTTTTPTLNVNSTGAKTIKGFKGAALTEAEYKWAANDAVTFIYNGTYWLMQNSSTQATRLSTAETSVTQTATSIESLASNTATYTKPDGTTGTNSMASAITQNAEGITLEAKKRESATNILLDADAPTTAKIYAPSSRYWSNSNKTWCTPSIVEISDPPIAGINYACRFVATDTGHTTDDYGRAIAFYGRGNTTDLPLKVGTKYTVSCWARCISGQGKLQISYRHKQTASRSAIAPTDLTPDWKYYTGTVELESMPTDYTRIWFYSYFLANTAGTIEICGMKLVAGDNVEAYSTKIEQMANNVLIQATANDTTAADGGQHLIQSLINVAPEGVTIDADKVNIAGATIFTSGRLSESSLNNAYDAKNSASAVQTNLDTEINQRKAQYGTCSTTASTQAKAVTCSNFELVAGNEITVKFSTANTYTGAIQLNVNSKGAKNVWVANAVTSSSNQLLWGAGAYITFRYDGTQFIVIGEPRTWYGASTTAADTAAKTNTTAIAGCVICKGAKIELAMTNGNTSTSATLNIQSTGAKNIYYGNTTTRPTSDNGHAWIAATTATFTFDGAYYRLQGQTVINGDNVTTGTISANRLDVAGIITAGTIAVQSDIPSKVSDLTNDEGFITDADVPTKVSDLTNDSGFQTATQVSTAVSGKADKTDAIARTQRIYYRKTSRGAPSKNTTWLSTSGTGYGNWSLKIPQMTNGTTPYPCLYTAVQTQTVSQQAAGNTCTCSDVLLDDTTTVIDGGNIITGTVSANAVDASSGTFDTANIPNLNASKILISDYNNYITASELNSATLAGPNCEIADGWIHKTGTDSNVWISPILDQWATEGEQYRITGIAKTTNAGRVRVAIYGRTGSTAEGFMYTPWISTEANTPTSIDEVLTITEDVASKPGINIAILFQENQNGTYASSEGYCKKMKCERMSGGSLIVDGSITADKIAANAVTANKIAANSITADKLAIGSVPSGGVNLLLETSVARTATISLNSSNYYVYDFYPLVRPLPKLFKEGELVTISFDWSTTATGGNFHLDCGASIPYIWGTVKNASGTRSATSNYIDITSSNTSGHAEITFAITNAVATAADTLRYFRIRIDGTETASKTITISNAKVERGGSASAWTPAPEDADIEYIIGTQTDTTGTWTGASSKTLYLYDGLRIRYYLPYAGSGNATLNLTNVKGNALGAKSVYRYGTTTLTTHYPTGSIVPLRYNGSAWMVDGSTNTDTYDRTRFNNAITANTAITAGRIICGTVNGYKNIGAGISFDTTCPLLYASSAIAATKTGTNNYLTMPSVVATNNGTITSAAAKKVLYLKGTLSGSTFTISASPFMTTAPTTDEGICYIPLGVMYDTTHIYFTSSQDIYSYQNGTLQKVDSVSKYVTRITDSGIRIHSSSTKNNSVVINDSGMEVFKGGTGATNSIAKFGTNSSSNTETFTKILYEVIALGDDVTVPELATADSGSTITVTTRRRNFESDGVSILVLTFTKGTSGTSSAIQYDGNSTFFNGNTDCEFTFLKVEYTATATPKIIRLGNTTTNKSGILFGNSNSNGNLDSFSVSLNGDINTLGSLYSANVGFTNVMGTTGSISKDVSTTSGTWTPLMNFSLIEGVYMAIADISFNANANGCRMANISATSAQNWQYVTQGATPGSSAKTSLTVPIILHPTETTTYYVNAYQNSGGSLNATVELYYVRIR